ncbi:hypothetical protein LTS10_000760 [Elasticomyces elasticus]|nr:hypothetical protein LTS10_000760 [Elasticomyces elasticus]
MESTTITKLPIELVCKMTGCLSMKDVRSFRQASRWTEKQSFRDFARRGFEVYNIVGLYNHFERLQEMIESSPQLVACIKSLHVNNSKNEYVGLDDAARAAFNCRSPRVSTLVDALPALERLDIAFFSQQAFAWHWQIKYPKRDAKLRSLSISNCSAQSGQFMFLVHHFCPTLNDLKLHNIVLDLASWAHVLLTVRDSSAQLSTLSLMSLRDPSIRPGEGMTLKAPGIDYHSTTRTSSGADMAMIRRTIASMKGPQAVKVGLDMIIQHPLLLESAYLDAHRKNILIPANISQLTRAHKHLYAPIYPPTSAMARGMAAEKTSTGRSAIAQTKDVKTPPLTKMPMEMISLIAGRLSMAELRNLRLVSHWVEVQTFNDFAARGFKVYQLQGQHDDIDRLQSMIELCPRLTSCIETLDVTYSRGGYGEIWYQETWNGEYRLVEPPEGREPASKTASVVSTLPGVKHLKIGDFGHAAFASHWNIGDLPCAQKQVFSELRSIDVSGCQASSTQLIALLESARSLVSLRFNYTEVERGGWRLVLRKLRDMSGTLEMLRLEQLTEYHSEQRLLRNTTELPLKTPAKDYCRATRTSSGVEMIMIRKSVASMKGVQAVQDGLGLVIQHLAGGG